MQVETKQQLANRAARNGMMKDSLKGEIDVLKERLNNSQMTSIILGIIAFVAVAAFMITNF